MLLVDTVMLCVCRLLLHVFPDRALDVSITLPPSQKVVGPFALITGAVGMGFSVTMAGAETPLQPLPSLYVTV